jgi:Fur family zinc uptake transcriptional regulator
MEAEPHRIGTPPLLGHDDHDHQACRTDALARAEARCAAMGLRLTAQRRQVLDVLSSSHVPMSAYEIIDRLGEHGRRPSPISVYRALDFLLANRFAHRIESRNAFLACVHAHPDAGATGGDPALVFLLCERCGAAAEAEPDALAGLLGDLAAAAGFAIRSSVIEVRGTCARCRADTATPLGDAA